jgi:nucleoside-diphosphate-sugar epimerase
MTHDPQDAPILVLGHGAVGAATVRRLLQSGRRVRVAQRRRPSDLAEKAEFVSLDVFDRDAVMAAARDVGQIVIAIGFAYDGEVWRQSWPKAIANVIDAAEHSHARVVFVDNLYMYGPQTVPLREDIALTSYGAKPAVRADITRQWMAARHRVRFAALRAPDFLGPGVGDLSHFGTLGFGALTKGQAATLIIPPDMPHTFAYVPDIARAVETLLDAPDDAYGEAWHVPSAPMQTARDVLRIGAEALGVKPRIRALPHWSLPMLALAMPTLKGFIEMRFQWDRPYPVDHTKFATRFWSDPTPPDVMARGTALSFKR